MIGNCFLDNCSDQVQYVPGKVQTWVSHLPHLVRVAKKEPQAAYAALAK